MTVLHGPVPIESDLYASRPFEGKVWRSLNRKESVLLLGPRQHGKTSYLLRLKRQLEDGGAASALIDLQGLPAAYTFRELLRWFTAEVADQLGCDVVAPQGVGEDSLDKWLDASLPSGRSPLVLLIDEASAIRDVEIRNAFYGQIRAFNLASKDRPDSIQARITFLFAGTFRPESLVDEQNSPFNTCAVIDCDDLDLPQIQVLLATAGIPAHDAVAQVLAESVGGQPHLIQLAAEAIEGLGGDSVAAAGTVILDWKQDWNVHVDSLFRAVSRDEGVEDLVSALLLRPDGIEVEPGNANFKFACVLGICRRDGNLLKFRNPLFAHLARERARISANSGGAGGGGGPGSADISSQAVVISVHGIRTRGSWQKDLSEVVSGAGLTYKPLDFGNFSAFMLPFSFFRMRKIKWFRDEVLKSTVGGIPPSVVAHSFGTYLAARALEIDPLVKYRRLIFCGSIVRPTFPWDQMLDDGRVNEVLNAYSEGDRWVRLVGWVVNDAGHSGSEGFHPSTASKIVQQRYSEFRHSDYFYRANYEQNWIPFLLGGGARGPWQSPGIPEANWRFRVTIVLLALIILVIVYINT